MFHDMFVYWSGLDRVQGTKNETLALLDPTHFRNIQHRGRGYRYVWDTSKYLYTLDAEYITIYFDMFVH